MMHADITHTHKASSTAQALLASRISCCSFKSSVHRMAVAVSRTLSPNELAAKRLTPAHAVPCFLVYSAFIPKLRFHYCCSSHCRWLLG
jgi:hypothetical protein